MPKFNEWLFGSKDKVKKVPTQTPEQQDIMKLLADAFKGEDNPFSSLFGEFNKEAFNEGVAKPQIKQFEEEILPMLREKFIAGNQVLGSGRMRAEGKAATDLQSRLAQLLYNAQQQHQQNRLQGLNTLLGTRGFENIYKQGETGTLPAFVGSFAKGGGEGAGQVAMKAIAG